MERTQEDTVRKEATRCSDDGNSRRERKNAHS